MQYMRSMQLVGIRERLQYQRQWLEELDKEYDVDWKRDPRGMEL
jgi:hypothetical protein